MQVIAGNPQRSPIVPLTLLFGCLLALTASAVAGTGAMVVGPLTIMVTLGITCGRSLLRWRSLLGALLLLILFIPIRRYTLSSSLPFELEPYRLFVALLAVIWITSLLIDPRLRLRTSGFETPFLIVIAVALVSIFANIGIIASQGIETDVVKKLTFFLSFVFVYYMIVSLVQSVEDVDFLLKILCGGGAVVGVFALIEFNSGYDFFDHLGNFIPILKLQDLPFQSLEVRGGQVRVYASSEHPIALGAAFVMLTPIGVYLAKLTERRRWWVATGVLALGALATISRTSILMILVVGFIFYRLHPVSIKRLWPMLVPAIVVIHIALPGSIGTLKESFFPKGGLIKEQQGAAGTRGSGRVADLGPALSEWSKAPLVGQGYGTRIVDQGKKHNADILDDQWLGTLLETGIIGVIAWMWMFVRFIRRSMRRARESIDEPAGWLYGALAAAIASYALGMVFYDAFSFIQVTFLLFILLALGATRMSIDARPRLVPAERLAGSHR